MRFTRSTTDVKVHQSLSDYPRVEDGMSAEELKKKFDLPAETLQNDLNGLIEELEDLNASLQLGANSIDENDTSDNNIQAKLIKLHKEIQEVTLGQIPDGSITEAKLNNTYSKSIAKKDTTEQIGLNSEMVGGKKLNDILNIITDSIKIGTYTGTSNGTNAYGGGNKTIEIGFKPRFVIIIGGNKLSLDFSITNQRTFYSIGSDSYVKNFPVTFSEIGISTAITGTDCQHYAMNALNIVYTYIAFK